MLQFICFTIATSLFMTALAIFSFIAKKQKKWSAATVIVLVLLLASTGITIHSGIRLTEKYEVVNTFKDGASEYAEIIRVDYGHEGTDRHLIGVAHLHEGDIVYYDGTLCISTIEIA